ncbi:SHOCT domain-containing protein [Halovivax limisalsi]|uniref:SHOCT domain-containing protein n=1 Tax=Halovivax limisalsi TaxID=1453760 RepID=UPI003CCDBB1D
MQDQCQYCSRSKVVPVHDKRIEQRSRPGNAYRRFCLACDRWLPMCSKEYYDSHPHPHVLPIGRDPEKGNIVELAEYDNGAGQSARSPQELRQTEQICDDLNITTTSLDTRANILNLLVSSSDDSENHRVGSTSLRMTKLAASKTSDFQYSIELLRALKKLYDEGVITSSEFNGQKKKILNRL